MQKVKASTKNVISLIFVLVFLLSAYTFLPPSSTSAAPGINEQINFQGKVVNSNGTNVTNGSYSFTFRIYSTASGDTVDPCANSCLWEETKLLTVTNGIFQTLLGDTTALPGSVDFNTDNIYLGVEFNSDSEMTPRIRFSASPYAFNADNLDGLDSTDFIRNSTTQQTSSNFNISGTGVAGTGLQSPSFDTSTATALSLGVTNATSITIGKNNVLTTVGGGLTVNQSVIVGNGSGNDYISFVAENSNPGCAAGNYFIWANSTDTKLKKCENGTISDLSSGGGGGGAGYVQLQSATPGTKEDGNINIDGALIANSLLLQNTAGTVDLMAFDTSNNHLKIYELGGNRYVDIYYDAATNEAVFAASSGTTRIGSGSGDVTIGLANAADDFIFDKTFTAGVNYSGTDFSITRNVSGGVYDVQGALVKIEDLSTTSGTSSPDLLVINQNVSTNGNLIVAQQAGSSVFQVAANGATNVKSASTEAFRVQNTSNQAVLTVDGSTGEVLFGTSTALGGKLRVYGSTSGSVVLQTTAVAGNYTLTLPGSAGNADECLKTNGSGVLSWGACGGGGTPKVTINPEYQGATFTPDSAGNSGTMTSDFCSGSSRLNLNTSVCGASEEHNYYTWTSTDTNSADYDIYVRYQLPSDFGGFASDTSIKMHGWRTDATGNTVDLALFQANGTQCGSTTNVATGAAAWTQTDLTGTETSCTLAAGDIVTFRVKVTALNSTKFVRAGAIEFTYNSVSN